MTHQDLTREGNLQPTVFSGSGDHVGHVETLSLCVTMWSLSSTAVSEPRIEHKARGRKYYPYYFEQHTKAEADAVDFVGYEGQLNSYCMYWLGNRCVSCERNARWDERGTGLRCIPRATNQSRAAPNFPLRKHHVSITRFTPPARTGKVNSAVTSDSMAPRELGTVIMGSSGAYWALTGEAIRGVRLARVFILARQTSSRKPYENCEDLSPSPRTLPIPDHPPHKCASAISPKRAIQTVPALTKWYGAYLGRPYVRRCAWVAKDQSCDGPLKGRIWCIEVDGVITHAWVEKNEGISSGFDRAAGTCNGARCFNISILERFL
ncbi:hypothetical protein BJY52DRAFT_1418441 [Lactarius psammicola]|nr:hypothetical protein BJY52DRAFT_1418441 [Lactarius psammicola]